MEEIKKIYLVDLEGCTYSIFDNIDDATRYAMAYKNAVHFIGYIKLLTLKTIKTDILKNSSPPLI